MKQLDLALQKMRMRAVSPYIKQASSVLDVGCADGVLYRELGPFRRYVGVDPDAPETPKSADVQFIRDMFPTSAIDPTERFDVIAVTAVLEHVPLSEQAAFAAACANCLVPGGLLTITVPSPTVDRILDVLKRLSLVDGMREDQHYGYDPTTTPAVFEPHGFRLERHRRFELGLNHLFVFRRSPA